MGTLINHRSSAISSIPNEREVRSVKESNRANDSYKFLSYFHAKKLSNSNKLLWTSSNHSQISNKFTTHTDLYFGLVQDAAFSWLDNSTAGGKIFGVTTPVEGFPASCVGSSWASSEMKRKLHLHKERNKLYEKMYAGAFHIHGT